MTVKEYDRRKAAGGKIELNGITKKSLSPAQNKLIKQVMSLLGKKGTGTSKLRGGADYYKNMVKIRESKKIKKGLDNIPIPPLPNTDKG